MPFRSIGKEVKRGTICKDTFRAEVLIVCADRIPADAASLLYLNVRWRKKKDDDEVPGQPDDAKPVTLTLRKLTNAASGDIRFDAKDGPTTKGFSRDVDEFLVIFGQAATAGSAADIGLDVGIEGEVQATITLSVGPVATSVAIRAENGTDEPSFFVLPETETRLKAVATPATQGIFGWVSAGSDLLFNSRVSEPDVAFSVHRPNGPLPPIADRTLRLAVLFTPDAGGGEVMAVHEMFPIYNPEEPGPFPVGRLVYPNADFKPAEMPLLAGIEGWPADIHVPLEGLVRYPGEKAGDGVKFSPRRAKYPLVILAHGRHNAAEFERLADGSLKRDGAGKRIPIKDGAGNRVEFKNFEGLEYLASHLASYGFVAASINLNGRFNPANGRGELVEPQGTLVTCRPLLVEETAIVQRGMVVLAHIQTMRDLCNAVADFKDKIDFDQIGLIGHSRGGEAVVSAQETNKTILLPLAFDEKIKAIVSIAPTDNRNLKVELPYLLIVGTDDGDVSDLSGLRIYDRAQPQKQGIIVTGAIHNLFSSNWQWQDEVPAEPPVTRAQHEAIAKGYCNLFLLHNLNGLNGESPYFTGQRRLDLPPTVELHFLYRAPGGLLVDAFEDAPPDKLKNALGQKVTPTNIAAFDEVDLHRLKPTCVANLPSWCHDTNGLMLEWSTLSAQYDSEIGGQSALTFETLSFRVGQDDDVANTAAAQDFKVRLTDSSGASATLKVSDFGVIPPVRSKSFVVGENSVTHALVSDSQNVAMLKTIRIPLRKFTQQTPALKLDALASLSFIFDEKVKGKLAFDEIEFSH